MEKNKKMKKFFIKNVIISIILLIILSCLNIFWLKYSNEGSNMFYNFPKEKLKVVNIGSSHSRYAIKYPENILGNNLALIGQKFYYDYKILEEYSKYFEDGCIVIVPISIFSFYDSNEEEERYIPILKKKNFLKISKLEYFMKKYFSVCNSIKNMRRNLEYLLHTILNLKITPKLEYPRNLSLEEKVNEAIKTSKEHLGIGTSTHVYPKEIGIENLKKIILYIEENNFIPILVSTPQSYLYNEKISLENYKERIYDNLLEVEKQLGKKYTYLDYSHDKRFENNLEYFSDDDHLNEKGAEYFTKILLDDIKKQGYNF